MILVYNKPVEKIVDGLFDLDIHESFFKGEYKGGHVTALLKNKANRWKAPFDAVSYSCGNDDAQCKKCLNYDFCFNREKRRNYLLTTLKKNGTINRK